MSEQEKDPWTLKGDHPYDWVDDDDADRVMNLPAILLAIVYLGMLGAGAVFVVDQLITLALWAVS